MTAIAQSHLILRIWRDVKIRIGKKTPSVYSSARKWAKLLRAGHLPEASLSSKGVSSKWMAPGGSSAAFQWKGNWLPVVFDAPRRRVGSPRRPPPLRLHFCRHECIWLLIWANCTGSRYKRKIITNMGSLSVVLWMSLSWERCARIHFIRSNEGVERMWNEVCGKRKITKATKWVDDQSTF